MSRILSVRPDAPDPETMRTTSLLVRGGGLVVFPTETFYGLGAEPMNSVALERLFDAKGRDKGKALPLVASDRGAVLRAVARWPALAEAMADAFWPGPLTIVLPASEIVPPLVHGGTGRVAVRVSSHPVASLLAKGVGGLITATSANVSGEGAATLVSGISSKLLEFVDGVLDAGPLPGGLPSTIVDLSEGSPRLLREGCVPWSRVLDVARVH